MVLNRMKEIIQWFEEKGFTCIKQIGQGSFGAILRVQSPQGNTFCAKIEILNPLEKSYLIYEAYILKLLKEHLLNKDIKNPGVLRMFSYEIIQDIRELTTSYQSYREQQSGIMTANIIFMEYGGISLNEFRKTTQITPQIWFDVFRQLIIIMQNIHNVGIIHRDLKPQNILIKQDDSRVNQVFVIDFGLARMVKKVNKQLIVQNKQIGFAGTINYASIRAHKGDIQHYADDLESLLYIMIFIQVGSLPWVNIGIKQSVEDMYSAIRLMKQQLIQLQSHQQEDKRFSQYSDKMNNDQIHFLRFYCNMIFKQSVGINFKKADYSKIISELNKHCSVS